MFNNFALTEKTISNSTTKVLKMKIFIRHVYVSFFKKNNII